MAIDPAPRSVHPTKEMTMAPKTSGKSHYRSPCAWLVVTLFVALSATIAAAFPVQIPGNFDPAFSKTNNLAIGNGNDRARATAVQADGKIVLAGQCVNAVNLDFCLARFNADGSLDASFTGPGSAAAGKFILPTGAGPGDNGATAIALQPDGKIIVAGGCFKTGTDYDFCIARLNPNGSRDSSFVGPGGAGNGFFPLSLGPSSNYAFAVVLQPDGKIVLAGQCAGLTNYDFCAARLNSNGSFDLSFVGPSGNAGGKFLLPVGANSDAAYAAALQPDGKIVLAGTCASNADINEFCAARLNADGSLDIAFNGPGVAGNGKFTFTVGGVGDAANSLLLQPDGNIVIAGYCANISSDFCAARLLSGSGAFDTSFVGPAGNSNGKFLVPIGTTSDIAQSAALQADGKIVLAGKCALNGFSYFCVARLNGDGSLDSTFDGPNGVGNGKVFLSIGSGNDIATSMAIQPDGKIVIAGYCSNGVNNDEFCVTRQSGGPYGNKNCSMDIDGDGKVLATTDAVLLARVALGVNGNAVVAGALGSGATRTNWTQIRAYLVTQCGMTVAP